MRDVLKTYQKKLTNLTATNRSLMLLQLSASLDMDWYALDFSMDIRAHDLLGTLVSQQKSVNLAYYISSRDAENNKISKQLRNLYQRQSLLWEERGVHELYVGYPIVEGRFQDGTAVRAPLLFFPVRLELHEFMYWKLHPADTETPFFNPTLMLAFTHFNQTQLDEEALNSLWEKTYPDMLSFKNALYKLLQTEWSAINFNSELYQNPIMPFKNWTKNDFDQNYKSSTLKLMPMAVLGFFQQTGSLLHADYDYMIANNEFLSFTDFFNKNQESVKKTDFVKEEQVLMPLAIDAFQENALRQVLAGKSLVVQGPPGTGKSQLICNVIANMVALNKKTLVICQKRVALEVIYERLQNIGLHVFSTLVHDFRNDRKRVFDHIHEQIEQVMHYKELNLSLDAIFLERTYLQVSREIEHIQEQMELLRKALFDTTLFGISVKELYLLQKNMPFNDLSVPRVNHFGKLNYEKLHSWVQKIQLLAEYEKIVSEHPVFKSVGPTTMALTPENKSVVLEIINNLPKACEETTTMLHAAFGTKFSLDDLEASAKELHIWQTFNSWINSAYARVVFEALVSQKNPMLWLEKILSKVEALLDTNLVSQPFFSWETLEEMENTLKEAQRNFRKIWYRHWYFYLKPRGIAQRKLIFAQAQEFSEQAIHLLIKNTRFEKKRTQNWLLIAKSFTDFNTLDEAHVHVPNLAQALTEAKELCKNEWFIRHIQQICQVCQDKPHEVSTRWYMLMMSWHNTRQYALQYFNEAQVKILSRTGVTRTTIDFLNAHFDTIASYINALKQLTDAEKEWFFFLKENTPPTQWGTYTQHAVFQNWMWIIEDKWPVLRQVSTPEMQSLEQRLQQLVAQKMKLSTETTLLKARNGTFRNLVKNRLHHTVSYRELKHQVTKKKRLWPLRRIIHTFYEEVMQLIPVWMASPETVSAIFDMAQHFDLVIFDEASQCFVEKGVPGLYRGQQVLVVGDDKQLQPNDLYRPRWEDTTDDTPETEIDSLLKLCELYLPSTMLCEHYRSKNPALIQFSNTYFYKNKLRLIPENKPFGSAIEYIKVQGIWQDQSNLQEAEKIIEILKYYLSKEPQKTVGIVTFNVPQQYLIETLVEREVYLQNYQKPTHLLIKNIENVQGDERDIIIFSIGYAPDTKGKLLAQFGSLNVSGGENRLNVAITRAREKVIIVSSIYPEALDVSHTQNEGPKLLKMYLQHALDVSNNGYKPAFKSAENRSEIQLKTFLQKEFPDQFTYSEIADLQIIPDTVVFTDDDSMLLSPSMKDWFAYVPMALHQKGWRTKRIFSRNYGLGKTFIHEGKF